MKKFVIGYRLFLSRLHHQLLLMYQHSYFKCKRGVRQGDPLSPLLFCIDEDVLSRGIGKLVEQIKLELIGRTRNFQVPSHTLYVDDIMVSCKGNVSSIQALKIFSIDMHYHMDK
jgi:hypothetical protein